jgi:signal transduction histidine kinase
MLASSARKNIGAGTSSGSTAVPPSVRVPPGSHRDTEIPTVDVVSTPIRSNPAALGRLLARTWLWGWPAIAQLVLDLLLALCYLSVLIVGLAGIVLLPMMLIGAPFLVFALTVSYWLGFVERARLFALTGYLVPAPVPPPASVSLWKRLLLDGGRWRALAHIGVMTFWGPVAGAVIGFLTSVALAATAVPLYAAALPDTGLNLPGGAHIDGFWWLLLVFALGVLGLAIVPLLARILVLIDVLLVRLLLGQGRDDQVERLSERVDTLTQTREATVDSVETERRRIERDLHDGPQQRLVAIAMDLGMAQERIDRDPAGARDLLDKAHAASKEAITEMRMVARGIHPPILTDRGLDAALSALAARSPVPVEVRVDLEFRPSPTVEAIAYFCVCEGLTNIAKHARAGSATVTVRPSTNEADTAGLTIEIRDDGVGGADPSGGTGLHGLTDRVRAVDGSLVVDSPPGGPTVLTIQLPGGRS